MSAGFGRCTCWHSEMAERGRRVESFTFNNQKTSRSVPENCIWHTAITEKYKKWNRAACQQVLLSKHRVLRCDGDSYHSTQHLWEYWLLSCRWCIVLSSDSFLKPNETKSLLRDRRVLAVCQTCLKSCSGFKVLQGWCISCMLTRTLASPWFLPHYCTK